MAEVERAFGASTAAGVSWADPHADRDIRDEEYSRVTDPERYRVIGARAMAWISAVTELGLATQHSAEVPTWTSESETSRAIKVTPKAPGALSIVVVLGWFESDQATVASIEVGMPPVTIEMLPVCGCDACDSGSEDLLSSVDGAFLGIMDGHFLYAEGRDWTITATKDGWSGTGSQDFDALVNAARNGHEIGKRMLTGARWWS
ncbi:hypothetical protein FFA01_16540 [Frigoribacterium faeni]|uniref:Uncharacterized protein n=1 Tax=Frigoribacterium faeni TaxID=145483 RepID=A0ABQ0UPD5_9MICO|nr:hypothetical protein GCM10025699_62950 [Microbacterium flavescens]GEK83345.1 hypothetical protein FFA01_16540 [Frigoribacterium faeni]